LWKHNCNNFSNDFATFLLGKGIPDHILHMPDAVLQSPMGRMLMPALNQQVEAGRQSREGIWGIQNGHATSPLPQSHAQHQQGRVRTVASSSELESVLAGVQKSCAVVFFTSATCAPCKLLYPLYDQLAAEVGDKAALVKVDINQAFDVASRYSVRATPTFISFLHGQEENRWSGVDQAALRGNVQLLVQMAHPAHPHASLRLPSLQDPEAKYVFFTKIPPLQKLLAKMGTAADHEAVRALSRFIEARSQEGPANDPLPEMKHITTFFQNSPTTLPPELMFTVIDLLRCALVDPRFSGVLAEEKDHTTILSLLSYVNGLKVCPYALRLVTLQMACNLFTTPLYPDQILTHEGLRSAVTGLISASFLDDNHSNVRVAAASLLFNVALANYRKRRTSQGHALPAADQIELAASLLEAIAQESESTEALQGMLLALGYLAYLAPLDGELVDLLRVMAADDTVKSKKGTFKDLALVQEIGGELLGKILRKP
jgi:desumoylating isopeptidase 1